MSNKIGVKNFRVFKEYTEFELRPITLLTGPNNSGKSSFTKLLLLLKNGINPLNFEQGNHNLESFSKVLNWNSSSDSLKLQLSASKILGPNYDMELEYVNENITSLSISSSKPILKITYREEKEYENYLGTTITSNFQNLFLDINYLIEKIYAKNIYVAQLEVKKVRKSKGEKIFNGDSIGERFVELKNIDTSRNVSKTLNLTNLKSKYIELKSDYPTGISNELANIALFNEIDQLKHDYLLIDVFAEDKEITKYYSKEILELQKTFFENHDISLSDGPNYLVSDISKVLKIIFSNIIDRFKKYIKSHFSETLQTNNIEISLSRLGNLIFTERVFDDMPPDDDYYKSTIADYLIDLDLSINDKFGKLEFISPNRGNQKRILQNSSENDINEIILEYSKLENKNLPFLNEALKIIGVEGELIVERYQNFISVVYIKTVDAKISLSDLGYGYSQIIPIILKIIITMNHGLFSNMQRGTLIIEEPESNLHPNLQSKIADIIKLSIDYYPYLKFIIETHSEYFIRKLQFLTAQKELSKEQTAIYYFNADKYVSMQEPKVRKIEITDTGNLTDTFGPGFYDEATRLQFDLLKINQAQSN